MSVSEVIEGFAATTSVEDQVLAVLASKAEKPAEEIRLDDDLLADLCLDSLTLAELSVLVDQIAGGSIPGDELIEASTVRDLVDLISRHQHSCAV
jgi:acyl carrier protein